MLKHISPLRYPGGKTKLWKYLSEIIKCNHPIDTYIEPFAGGSGAALKVLFSGIVKNIILNDADECIYKFWLSILNNTEDLLNKIKSAPINVLEWKKQRALLENKELNKKASDLEIGFATFYINRCNRSGIITFSSGPIGGYKQHGKWKIDSRFNKRDLINKIEKIASYKEKIEIFNLDAIDFLEFCTNKLSLDKERTLIYLDPPYFEKGPDLYRLYFRNHDHIRLHNYLKNNLRVLWVLSYDDVPYIKKLYDGINKNGFLVNHFAYKAKVGKELMIFSDDCKIPSYKQ